MTVRALSKGHRIAFVPWARVGEMCPVSFAAFYKQRLRWAMGWEQVTYRRMVLVFNSTSIEETRKWRTALLPVMRYWSISSASFATAQIILRPAFTFAGVELFDAQPLVVLGFVQTAIFLTTVAGHFIQVVRQAEPWWRAAEVAVFMPTSAFYLCFQASLIIISWFKLSCGSLEWVPTARSSADQQHAIKMEAKKS